MMDLIEVATAFVRSEVGDPIKPHVMSTARDLLCLAETEARLGLRDMSRSAEAHEDGEVLPTPTVPEMFIELRNTDKDCKDILETIDLITQEGEVPETTSDEAKEIGAVAVDRLAALANAADLQGEHRFAAQIDALLTAIFTS